MGTPIPYDRTLPGNVQGWRRTNITVSKGDEIRGAAQGWITFFVGYDRNPDGKDKNGNTEIAGPSHPAPNRTRNSLVLRIGGEIVQAGTQFRFTCPSSGELEMSNNDDYSGDNFGQWTIQFLHYPAAPSQQVPTAEQLHAFNMYQYAPTHARKLVVDKGDLVHRFADEHGREVVFRGVNFGARSKFEPYLPVLPAGWRKGASLSQFDVASMDAALAEAGPSLDWLPALGFNVARVPIIWKAMEPRVNPNPGQLLPEARHYLEMLTRILDALYRRGIYVFLDFHQDIAHDAFGGDGFPDWAMAVDAQYPRLPDVGFENEGWILNYHKIELPLGIPVPGYRIDIAERVRLTLKSFWQNRLTNTDFRLKDFPVQDHLVALIGQVARYFKQLHGNEGHPAIIGYEPFNEPHQAGISADTFETTLLPTYYAKVHREIRKYDRDAFVFVEPRVDWTTFDNLTGPEFKYIDFTRTPTTVLGVQRRGNHVHYSSETPIALDDRVVFSFHHYDPWVIFWHNLKFPCFSTMQQKETEWPGIYDQMCGAAVSRGLIPFLTEFGGSQRWTDETNWNPPVARNQVIRAYMELQFRQVEQRALNATYWNFDLYNTAGEFDGWNREDFSLLGPERKLRKWELASRLRALRSRNTSSRHHFDLQHKIGGVLLQAPTSGTTFDAPAVVYVPAFEYADSEFVVRTTAKYVRWDARRRLLYWLPVFEGQAAALVIHPPAGFDPKFLPAEFRDVFPLLGFSRLASSLQGPVS